MGKKQDIVISIILGSILYPNHRTNMGAIATVGIVCVITSTGYMDLYRNVNRSIKKDTKNAMITAINSPIKASDNVVKRFLDIVSKSLMKARNTFCGDGSKNSETMPNCVTKNHMASINVIKIAGAILYMIYLKFFKRIYLLSKIKKPP